MLIKMGDKWFTLDGANLVAADAPESEPEAGTFFDATDLVTELDGLDYDPAKASGPFADRSNELIAEYRTAAESAQSSSKREDVAAATALLAPAAVANHIRDERRAATGLPELKTPPNESVDIPGQDGVGDEAGADTGGGAGAGGAGGDDGSGAGGGGSDDGNDDGAGGSDDGDGSGDPDFKVPDDLSGLSMTDVAMVTAAAVQIITGSKPGGGGSLADAVTAAAPGQLLTNTQGPVVIRREQAPLKAATNVPGVTASAVMTNQDETRAIQEWARSAKGGRGATSMKYGSYEMHGRDSMIASASGDDGKISGSELDVRRSGFRNLNPADKFKAVTAAAPDRCGPADVRREIPDCGDVSSPMLDLLQTYAAPHCELEFHRDISLALVADGITTWDAAARAAYQSARDAWIAAKNNVASTATQLAEAYGQMKAAEKGCVDAGCAPTDTVTMLTIAACLTYPTDLEYCSPDAITAYRRALNRLFIREQSAAALAQMQAQCIGITADASARPFVNGDTPAVRAGASDVLDMICSHLKPQGVMAERVTEANYSVVMPYGLQAGLELDDRLGEGVEAISSVFGGARVITSLDTATGTPMPFSALPATGSVNPFTSMMLPTDWSFMMLDLNDFFQITRPDIEVGAQITPESIMGNMVFGGFMESSAGIGKDGCHPGWTIDVSNLVYNGARVDNFHPAQFGHLL